MDFWTELGEWVREATERLGSRKEAVARAEAAGGRVSYDTWRKVEQAVEPPRDATLRGIALGVGVDPEALVRWRHGGPKPALPTRARPRTLQQLAAEVDANRAETAGLKEAFNVLAGLVEDVRAELRDHFAASPSTSPPSLESPPRRRGRSAQR